MFQRLRSQILIPVLISAIGAGGMLWLSSKDAPPERVAKQPTAPLVETVTLQLQAPSFQIHVNGNVVPQREVTLSAEVPGAIVSKGTAVESGRHVRQGSPLLDIDPARFKLQVDELASELDQVAADVRRLAIEEKGALALIDLASREAAIATAAMQRLKDLQNAVTDSQLDAVKRTELQARNALSLLQNEAELIPIRRERLQAQQKLMALKQQQAQLNLDRTQIVAPFDGVITMVHVEQGDYVQTGDMLLTLEDTEAVDIECSLRMDDLYWLWNSAVDTRYPIDQPEPSQSTAGSSDTVIGNARSNYGRVFEIPATTAHVTGEVAGQVFHWDGQLARYQGRGVNRKTRTVACRVVVNDPIRNADDDGPPTLMRGMFVDVALDAKPRIPLLFLPSRSIQPNGQVCTVHDGVLKVHSVQPAKVLEEGVLVRAESTNLKPGDRVVVTQMASPLDGIRVRELTTPRQADPFDDRHAAKKTQGNQRVIDQDAKNGDRRSKRKTSGSDSQ